MNKKYLTESISDETLAKLIDTKLNYEKSRETKKTKLNLLKIIPAVAAIVLIIGLINILPVFFNSPPVFSGDSSPNYTDEEGNPADPMTRCGGNSYTFLVVGTDNGLNTDTIMFMTFNTKDSTAAILNIPRDTYVKTQEITYEISGASVAVSEYTGKINGAFAKGYNAGWKATQDIEKAKESGIKFLQETIKYTFGLPCDRYIMIDLKGFKFLVDKIGGVEMYVPQDMTYSDPYQGLYINLKEGWQTLDGGEAEQLVRFRKGYDTQDIGRIETQQKFIAALTKKLFKFNAKNLSALLKTAEDYMQTDLSINDAAWFAAKALNVKLENIRTHTVPGGWVASVAGYEVYKPEIIEIINKYYNPYNEDIPETNFNIHDGDLGSYRYPVNIDGVTMDNLVD